VNDQWRVIAAVWGLGALGMVVGCVVFFLPQMGPIDALRWGIHWGVRMVVGFSVLAFVVTVLWVMVRPDGPGGPGRSGPMSPAG
jgi:hypothetical protein